MHPSTFVIYYFFSCISNSGFNVETVEYKNISFTVWDVGGQDKVWIIINHASIIVLLFLLDGKPYGEVFMFYHFLNQQWRWFQCKMRNQKDTKEHSCYSIISTKLI